MAYTKVAQRKRFGLLRDAYNALHEIPEQEIMLNAVCSQYGAGSGKPGCGTIACGIGWLGLMPKFQARGLKTHDGDFVTFNGTDIGYADAASALFGLTYPEAQALFGTAGTELHARDKHKTHKKILLNRIMRFLEKHGQVETPTYY